MSAVTAERVFEDDRPPAGGAAKVFHGRAVAFAGIDGAPSRGASLAVPYQRARRSLVPGIRGRQQGSIFNAAIFAVAARQGNILSKEQAGPLSVPRAAS